MKLRYEKKIRTKRINLLHFARSVVRSHRFQHLRSLLCLLC